MPPTDAEFEELRSRVERLERQVAELTQPVPPPVLPPVLKPAPQPPPAVQAKPRQPISSTAWIAGIGAVIFLIGAIYGLTVAIQRGWMSPSVRVGLGLIVGAILGASVLRHKATRSRPHNRRGHSTTNSGNLARTRARNASRGPFQPIKEQ